jgi:alpha-amylase
MMYKTKIYSLVAFLCFSIYGIQAQVQNPKDLVILQGFYWDVFNNPTVQSDGGLYSFLNKRVGNLKAAQIDMIYLPPPSRGDQNPGMGYHPTQLFDFNSSFGTETQLRTLVSNLKTNQMRAMADVVINHRSGSTAWADFTNPVWGCEAIAENDEVKGVAGQIQPCSGQQDSGEGWSASRDLNHNSSVVKNGVKEFLNKLKEIGFDSWRYDFVKGFSGSFVQEYNNATSPFFAVGEHLTGWGPTLKDWIDTTGKTAAAFDFDEYYRIGDYLKGNHSRINGGTSMSGLSGIFGYADRAVTFVENHDTFAGPSVIEGDNIMKAYAYILTHPGIPCIFLQHYYGGTASKTIKVNGVDTKITRTYPSYEAKINELVAVRKSNGLSAYSALNIVNTNGFYAAYIDDKVALVINNDSWSPSGTGWSLNTSGPGYKVWSKATIDLAPTVSISPIGGTFASGTSKTVTITASHPNSTPSIRYTLDGSEPTSTSTLYISPLNISTTTTVKAKSFTSTKESGVASEKYEFVTAKDITVWFKPPASWVKPAVHYWGATPTGNLVDGVWATPTFMTLDTDGYYKYTFKNILSVNLLFRDGNSSSGVKGTTQTENVENLSGDARYSWQAASPFYKKEDLSNESILVESDDVFSISPNPTKGNIKITSKENFVSYQLISVDGSLVNSGVVSNNQIDLSTVSNGNYIIKIVDVNGNVKTSKVVKL